MIDCDGFRALAVALLGTFAFASSVEARLIRDHRNPSVAGSAYTLRVTPIVDVIAQFPAGARITCATSNSSAGADPWLHVFFLRPNNVFEEFARDDDSAGALDARVTFNVPADGKVRLVMRAAGDGATGTADLKCDGYQALRALPVGGAFKRIEGYRRYENLFTVPLPGGPFTTYLYLVDHNGRIDRRFDSDASGTAFALTQSTQFVVLLGSHPGTIKFVPDGPAAPPTGGVFERRSPGAATGGARTPPVAPATPGRAAPGGVARLPDTVLEAELLRLPDAPGDVRLIRNDLYIANHDADGDGLGDELEAHIGTCSAPNQVRGNWECSRSVDMRDTDGDGLSDRIEVMGTLGKQVVLLLPRWGADPLHKDIFLEVDFMLREQGEAPQKMSAAVALDLAKIFGDPETSELFRLAHAQVLNNPDLKAGIRLHMDTGMSPPAGAPVSHHATYGDWGGYNAVPTVCDANGCKGDSAGNVYDTMMHASRRGVFHYALGYPGSGGQASINSILLNMPLGNAAAAAHEFGHTLGIGHGGPDGIGPDANCKPNYPSLMSYAYMGRSLFVQSFSDGYGRSALNNVELKESGAVSQPSAGPGKAYLAHLRDIFRYNVDLTAGHVDWDRDGAISPAPVKAYANNDHTSCEFTRVNGMDGEGLADGALSLTRLGARTFLFYIDERDRRLHFEFTDNNLACPALGTGCGPPLQRRDVNETWNDGVLAFDAHPIGSGAQRKLLVVFRTAAGLFETTMGANLAWSAPAPIATASGAIGEVSLAGGSTEGFLAYKNAAGQTVLKRRTSAGVWGADEIAADATGAQLAALAPDASPGILLAAYKDGRNVLLGAFPIGPTGGLQLHERDAATGRWARSAWPMGANATIGRPALAIEPVAAGSPLPGRLRILYIRRPADADGRDIVRLKTLEAIGLGAAARPELTDEIFDNVWYYGKGLDLLYERGVDSNLRAAVATAQIKNGTPAPHIIQLRPKADGVVHFLYRNWNDWEALGIGVCRTLREKGGADVNCPPWAYSPPSQPMPPSQPPPPQPEPEYSLECLEDCREIFDLCRAQGESAGQCVRRQSECRAQCRIDPNDRRMRRDLQDFRDLTLSPG